MQTKKIKLHDLEFEIFKSESQIQEIVKELAAEIQQDLGIQQDRVLYLPILNGATFFSTDLLKLIEGNHKLDFLKASSYQGTNQSGTVTLSNAPKENLEGQDVVILEDIVDTGLTLHSLIEYLETFKPNSIRIATLFFKPEAYRYDRLPDYIGSSIPNRFIVGYGMDYDGLGRTLPAVYVKID